MTGRGWPTRPGLRIYIDTMARLGRTRGWNLLDAPVTLASSTPNRNNGPGLRSQRVERRGEESANSARDVGLRYVADVMPGISRARRGAGFQYRFATGDLVHNPEVLRRIHS